MLILLLSFLINEAIASPANVEVLKSQKDSKVLMAIIRSTTPTILKKECLFKDKVRVGNDINGYETLTPDKDGCISFIPISYKNIINFYVNNNLVLQKKYKETIPLYYKEKNSIKFNKNFSFKYNILSAKEDSGHGFIFSYVYIINNEGDLIWIHLPKVPNFKKVQYITSQFKNGYLYTLHKGEDSHFQKVNLKGEVIFSLDNSNFYPKRKFHHDFILNDNKVLFLTQQKGFVRKSFFKKPFNYVYDEIISVDLKTKKYNILWSTLDYFNILKPNLTRKKKDFTHANSLSINKKGEILISIRNQNTLIKLSKNYKLKWSIGPYGNIFCPKKFLMQHHAQLLDNSQISLFDNQRGVANPFSRGLVINIDEENLSCSISKEIKSDKRVFSKNRSSFTSISNGNFIILYVLTGTPFDLIKEFDQDGKEINSAEIPHDGLSGSGGYRAVPLDSLSIHE